MEVQSEARDAAPTQSSDAQVSEEVIHESDTLQESSTDDKVAYATFSRNLSKLKKTEAENKALQDRLRSIEAEKLEATGQKDELIVQLKKQVNELEEAKRRDHASFAYKAVTDQIEREALKMGCIDTEALVKLSALDELEVDEEFNVASDSIKRTLEQVRKTKPYLFEKPGPKVKDAVPSAKSPNTDVSKMSLKELKDHYRSLG